MTMNEEFQDHEGEAVEWAPPSAGQETASVEEVEKLAQALEQKTREAAEAQDRYLRTYADFENYRKRMQRDTADFRKYANEQLASELLSVVDHLGLALKHADESPQNAQGLREGVELVHRQFRDVLEKAGVKPFASQGQPFDPARHDALMQVETADLPENTVAQVMQEGYLYHDKVLRHAKVAVAKRPASASAGPAGSE